MAITSPYMYGVDLSGLGTLGKKSEAGFDRFFYTVY
jgi:hypothetical protein